VLARPLDMEAEEMDDEEE
jgi:hypothetical protein